MPKARIDFTNPSEHRLINVAPPVTNKDVVEFTENPELFPRPGTDDDPAFVARYTWAPSGSGKGGALDYRTELEIGPGESTIISVPLVAKNISRLITRDQGNAVILVEPDTPESKVVEMAQAALEAAARFYSERGGEQLRKYKRRHGLSDTELQEDVGNTEPYIINQAKADLLRKHIRSVRKMLKEALAEDAEAAA